MNPLLNDGQLRKKIAELRHPDQSVRISAARRLGFSRKKQATPALLQALKEDSLLVRWEIAEALGRLGDAELIAPLSEILLGFPTYLRLHAAWILGKLKDPSAVDVLIQSLQDLNWFGRAHAAWALGEIGDWRSIPELVNAYDDQENAVREAAQSAVRQIYSTVTTVYFGQCDLPHKYDRPHWINPDVTSLLLPLSQLRSICLHANSYELFHVERFLTYSLNSLGQDYFRNSVEAYIYGEAGHVHPNLRNTLSSICKQVHVRESASIAQL
jgi:HEAT repeat protein